MPYVAGILKPQKSNSKYYDHLTVWGSWEVLQVTPLETGSQGWHVSEGIACVLIQCAKTGALTHSFCVSNPRYPVLHSTGIKSLEII